MEEVKMYKSKDGVSFTCKDECIKHEQAILEREKKEKERDARYEEVKDAYNAFVVLYNKYRKDYGFPHYDSIFDHIFDLF